MDKELLPLGSVVELNCEANQRFLVIGYYPEDEDMSYDYLLTLYPQGMFEFPYVLTVNVDEIVAVVHRGYESEESKAALSDIKEMMDDYAAMNVALAESILHYADEHPDEFNNVIESIDAHNNLL